jgi:Holliday junction resolvase RusA-like endonuclease
MSGGRQVHKLADTDKLLEAKDTLDGLLLPFQPAQPIAGPVYLTVQWCWPWLASHSKRVRALGRIRHTSKPDLSNVLKTLEDRLVRFQFIEDDSKVVTVLMSKWWGDDPGISVLIDQVSQ